MAMWEDWHETPIPTIAGIACDMTVESWLGIGQCKSVVAEPRGVS